MFHRRLLAAAGLVAVVAVTLVPSGGAVGIGPALAAETGSGRAVEMTAPLPDWDNPRKITLQVTAREPEKFEGAMSNAMNLRKFYGPDEVKLAIITYGGGVRHLLKESPTAPDRVSSLQSYGIEIVVCGNTLDTIGKSEEDLLPGVTVVSTGIAEVVERQLRGWITIVP